MRLFYEKILLDILHSKSKFLIIFLGLLLSSSTIVTFSSLSSSLEYTTIQQNSDLRLGDIIYKLSDLNDNNSAASNEIISKVINNEAVEAVEGFYQSSITISRNVENNLWSRNSYLYNLWSDNTSDHFPAVDRVILKEGRFFNSRNESAFMISEYLWDLLRGQDFGDQIQLNKYYNVTMLGKEVYIPLIGVVYNPRLWNFCFIPTGYMESLSGEINLINVLSVRLKTALVESQPYIDEITSIIQTEANVINFRVQYRNESLTPQVRKGVDRLADIIGIGTLLIGLILIYYILSTHINDQKQEIAVLRSTGATNYHIVLFYTIQAVVIGIFSMIMGLIIGIFIGYSGLILLSETERLSSTAIFHLDLEDILFKFFITLIMIIGSSFIPSLNASRFSIVKTLQKVNDNRINIQIPKFLHSRFLFPSFRYAFINILTNLRSSFMRIISILLVLSLIFSIFSLTTNFQSTLDFAVDEEFTFDLAVQFTPYIQETYQRGILTFTIDQIVSLMINKKYIANIDKMYGDIGRFNINNETTDRNFWVFGIDNNSTLMNPKILDGRWIQNKNEIVISEKIANEYNFQLGTNISLSVPNKDSSGNFTIVGIAFTLWQFGDTVYCEKESLQTAFDIQNQVNMLLIKLNNTDDVEAIKNLLISKLEKGLTPYSQYYEDLDGGIVLTKDEIQEMLVDIRDSVSLLFYLINFLLIFNVVLLILVMTNLDLSKRIIELATMKSIGMVNFQSFKMISVENLLLNSCSAFCGIILSIPLFNYFFDQMNRDIVPLLYSFNIEFFIQFTFVLIFVLTIPSVLLYTTRIMNKPVANMITGQIRK